ncbi:MAG: winged helix-turn-helix domain-containing protein [Planctomycetota bacterium]
MPKALTITYTISRAELRRLEKREKSAIVRARLTLVRLTLQHTPTTVAAETLGLNPGQACLWIKRFNAHGPDGLRNLPRRSRPSRLKPELNEAFKARVRAGSMPNDGVAVLRGKDFRRILRDEFQAPCSLGGTYFILHRLGFSSLYPRPQHPESDPAAQEEFKKTVRPA